MLRASKVNSLAGKIEELTRLAFNGDHDFDDGESSYYKWQKRVTQFLSRAVSPVVAREFTEISEKTWRLRRESQIGMLEGLVARMLEQDQSAFPSGSPAPQISQQSPHLKKVFVVHGHDTEAKESVARFIERLGLEPIILHEQPNSGRTIIEKFEVFADVGFAVVLLTPDDVGAPATEHLTCARSSRRELARMLFLSSATSSVSSSAAEFAHSTNTVSSCRQISKASSTLKWMTKARGEPKSRRNCRTPACPSISKPSSSPQVLAATLESHFVGGHR